MKRYSNCSKRFFVMLLACLTVTCMMAQYKDATRHQSQGSSKPSTSKQATSKTSSKSSSKTSTKVAPKTTAPRRNKYATTPQEDGIKLNETGKYKYEKEEVVIEEPVDNSYLQINGSDEPVKMSKPWQGGQEWISASTNVDGGFEIAHVPSWCVATHKSSSGFYLECAPNSGSSSRSGMLELQAGSKTNGIKITQAGNSSGLTLDEDGRSAIINKVWFEKNVMDNGVKKLLVHLDLNVNKLAGERFRVYLHFFCDDNATKLTDNNGTVINYFAYGNSQYHYSHWDDFKIFVHNNLFLKAHNFKKQCTIDIEVTDDSGKRLGYKRNCITVGK